MIKDNWIPFKEVDFNNENIVQFNIDTRDFHVSLCDVTEKMKIPEFSTLLKYPERFIYSSEEIINLLTRYYNESGGEREWRMLELESDADEIKNWELKYIRIFRAPLLIDSFFVCNSNKRALRKSVLESKVLNRFKLEENG
jgi:hypothetical protein